MFSNRRRLFALLLIPAVFYAGCFLAVFLVSRQDQRQRADAIVVLGAAQYNGKPSPVLRARLDHALALYHEGLASTVDQQYLTAQGVPRQAIVVRPEGRSTQASIAAVARWAEPLGVRRVLLVSDPFHMLRLRFEARNSGLEALASPTTTSPISASVRRELGFLSAEAWKIPVVVLRALW